MPNTIEQIRDSRVWDLRDQGYDVSKVEMRPVGDKWILSVQMERPISVDEDLHPKISELAEPSAETESTEEHAGSEAGSPPTGGSGESGTDATNEEDDTQ